MNRFLNLHSLTTYNSVLLVRDADGRPKEIPFGTALRTMLSPQTQRRASRTYLRDQANLGTGPLAGYAFGIRTREWGRLTARELADTHHWEHDAANIAVKEAFQGLGLHFGTKTSTADLTKVMIFAPEHAAKNLATVLDTHRQDLQTWLAEITEARQAQENKRDKTKKNEGTSEDTQDTELKIPPLPNHIKKPLLAAFAPADAIDIALFGRFLAEIADSPNIDGAIQTMAAITVHPATSIDDFYSSADDVKLTRQRTAPPAHPGLTALDALDAADPFRPDDRGAGMTGYQSLVSGTFYAHSVLDRAQLRDNLRLGGTPENTIEQAAQAAELAYLEAFCHATPAAKKNTTAAPGTLPQFVLAFSSPRQHNYAPAFENAIDPTAAPASLTATKRLLDQHTLIHHKFGTEPGHVLTYDVAVTELLTDLKTSGRLLPTEVDTPLHLSTAASPTDELAGLPA